MSIAQNGVCCGCSYEDEEETECPYRENGQHCEHWYDGPDLPPEPTTETSATREKDMT